MIVFGPVGQGIYDPFTIEGIESLIMALYNKSYMTPINVTFYPYNMSKADRRESCTR